MLTQGLNFYTGAEFVGRDAIQGLGHPLEAQSTSFAGCRGWGQGQEGVTLKII